MDSQRIRNIITKGEGLTVEFKKAGKELPKNLFETFYRHKPDENY